MNAITNTLFLCGDVMTGRGVDQILPSPSDPRIYEEFVRDARDYVRLAEIANGPLSPLKDLSELWHDVSEEFRRFAPDVKVVNLETAITTSQEYWPGKGINYRMSPSNAPLLSSLGVDCCALANNHTLDWGYQGLEETLAVLKRLGIRTCGAGTNRAQAVAPAVLPGKQGTAVGVLSIGLVSSGIPVSWSATAERGGLFVVSEVTHSRVEEISDLVRPLKATGTLVVASIHWGGNWGYEISDDQRWLAHALIDHAGVDIIHGHSSHHVKALEVYKGKLIMYGCGDFINDYEGIGGYERYRADLGCMYFPTLDAQTGELLSCVMVPTRIFGLRPHRVAGPDAQWLARTFSEHGFSLGTWVELSSRGDLVLQWSRP